jgi:predicted nucleotidyltransferase
MRDRGLNPDGTIAREGSLDRVTARFAPVVAAARTEITGRFRGGRLHSAYLYGSIPRGTAVPGTSDLDMLLVLQSEPTAGDRADADAAEAVLDGAFDVIDGAGILLVDVGAALSELERYDLGFFVSCLCTPLLGEDLAARLPPQHPTSLLARETNGDLALVLPRWREGLRSAGSDAERRALCRRVARRVVRSGFTLVMPRWGGWTSDLHESAELFVRHYPERAVQMTPGGRRGPHSDAGRRRAPHSHRGPGPLAGGRVHGGARREGTPPVTGPPP